MKQSLIIAVCLLTICFFGSCDHPSGPDSNSIPATYPIAFAVGHQLCTMNTDGTNLQVIASGPLGTFLPWNAQISSDGSLLVYQFADSTVMHIFLLDRTTHQTKRITNDNAYHERPSFSPDGQTIIFTTAQGWLQNLCSYDLRNGIFTQLTQGLNCFGPSFSKDGLHIVFYLGNGLGNNGVAIVDKTGNDFHFLGLGSDPVFFPSGNRILFQDATSAYDNGLFSFNTDGSNKMFYANIPWQSDVSISPDGQKIIADYSAGNPEIISINSDGTGFTNLTKDTAAERCPKFLRDGRTIMYVVFDTSQTFFLDQSSLDGTNRRHVFESALPLYLFSS